MATTNTWYKAGTVSTTAASKIVTGTGTTWSLQVNIGDIFTINGAQLYEVESIQGDTSLTLAKAYPTTAATQAYAIIRNFTGTIPSELAAKLAAMQERWYKSLGDYTNLVTSTAATVTLTKTDGTTVTVPTFAAMVDVSKAPAKVHADAAAVSAATATTKATEAATSATAAAQAVIDVAAPFPDVWIPFNDDLSMLAGRNDGAKKININGTAATVIDGKTVSLSRASTATYVDKSGVIRTAEIDGARFEKDGLLIEGQSTNLLLNSATLIGQSVTVLEGTYTLSFYGSGTVSTTGASVSSTVGSETGRSVKTITTTAGSLVITVSGSVINAQLEQLPLASSYIPTSGAAATRAADKCIIQYIGNFNAGDITVSAQMNYKSGVIENPLIFVTKATSEPSTPPIVWLLRDTNAVSNIRMSWYGNGTTYNADCHADNGFVARFSNNNREVLAEGIIHSFGYGGWMLNPSADSIQIGGYRTQALWGHIRNFRIWHSALSDAQIKALK